MNDREILKKVVIKNPDDLELTNTGKFYIRAFESTDLSKAEDLVNLWKLFIGGKICHFLVAKYKERTIGCGALVPYRSLAWIGWMATDPDFQRKGIGNEIMKNLIEYAENMEIISLKLDATTIGKKLYSKFKFQEEYRVLRYEIISRSSPNEFNGLNVSVSNRIPQWCLRLDEEAFGDDRSSLLRLLLNNGGKVILIDNEGYGILWRNRVGPVVAENTETAMTIVNHAHKIGVENIYIPLHRDLPEKFLSGLKEKKRNTSFSCCTRMAYGYNISEDTKKVYASFGAGTG